MQRLGCFLQRFVSAPRSTKEPAPAAQVFAQLIHMISARASRGQVRDHDLVHQRGWHELASLKVGGSIWGEIGRSFRSGFYTSILKELHLAYHQAEEEGQ